MRPLGPFKQHATSTLHGLVDKQRIVNNVTPEAMGILIVFFTDASGVEPSSPVDVTKKIVDFHHITFHFFSKDRGMQKVSDSNPGPGHFIHVGRPDSFAGGPNAASPFRFFRGFVNGLMIRQNQMRTLTDRQIAPHLHSSGRQLVQFSDQCHGVDDDSVSQDALFAPAQDSRRK